MKPKHIILLDGFQFSTLEEFFKHFTERALNGSDWGHNLDAFNDVLRGGFGTPEGGFIIEWLNHNESEQRLGYPETVRQLQRRLKRCHPSNAAYVEKQLAAAQNNEGNTVYDWLLEIIEIHCPGGREEEDRVELLLR